MVCAAPSLEVHVSVMVMTRPSSLVVTVRFSVTPASTKLAHAAAVGVSEFVPLQKTNGSVAVDDTRPLVGSNLTDTASVLGKPARFANGLAAAAGS